LKKETPIWGNPQSVHQYKGKKALKRGPKKKGKIYSQKEGTPRHNFLQEVGTQERKTFKGSPKKPLEIEIKELQKGKR